MAGTELLILAGAAQAGLGAQQLSMSRQQGKLDIATIEANKQQAKLQAAEQALNNAQGFRKALASQMALASFRGGPGSSVAAQFGAESFGAFTADQAAIQRGVQQIETASRLQKAGARSARQARDIGIIGGTAKGLLGTANLSGMFGGGSATASVNPQSFRG